MDCVIVAGGRLSPQDPLYTYGPGQPKALLEVGDRTMLESVVAALQESDRVEQIVVVGLGADTRAFRFARPVSFCPDQGTIVANVAHGLRWLRDQRSEGEAVLLSTGDIPLLTPQAVNTFVERCRPFDRLVYYSVVTRAVLERRFPNSQRTYVPLRDVEVSGGNLFVVQPRVLETNEQLWQNLAAARKYPWRLARQVGLWTLLRFGLRRITLAEAERRAGRLVGGRVCAVVSPDPEVAMDVDKPEHLALVNRHR